MAKYLPNANPAESGYATGYMFASVLADTLKRCGDDLTRENIMRQAASIKDLEVPLLVPGSRVNSTPTDFYPVKDLQMSRMEGGHWIAFGPLMSRNDR